MNRKVLYGYQIEDGKLVPQPQEAAVVSRIFALCLEGKFQREISDILNAEGIQRTVLEHCKEEGDELAENEA